MFITHKGIDWGALMAASTLACLSIVILFSVIKKNVVNRNIAGAVK